MYKYSINVNGVPTSVNYVNGYPDFSDYMHKSKGISQTIKLTGNRNLDEALANAKAGFGETPVGYTWHHDIPPGEMRLVRTDVHEAYSHIGGFSVGK